MMKLLGFNILAAIGITLPCLVFMEVGLRRRGWPIFVPVPHLRDDDVQQIVETVAHRLVRLLSQRDVLDEADGRCSRGASVSAGGVFGGIDTRSRWRRHRGRATGCGAYYSIPAQACVVDRCVFPLGTFLCMRPPKTGRC